VLVKHLYRMKKATLERWLLVFKREF